MSRLCVRIPFCCLSLIALSLMATSPAQANTAFCTSTQIESTSGETSCGAGDGGCTGAGGSPCGPVAQSTASTAAVNDWNTKCNKHCTDQVDPAGKKACVRDGDAASSATKSCEAKTNQNGQTTDNVMTYTTDKQCSCKATKIPTIEEAFTRVISSQATSY